MKKIDNSIDKIIVRAIWAATENDEYCTQCNNVKKGFIYRLKYFTWFCLLTVLSPLKFVDTDLLVCATTKLNQKSFAQYINSDKIFKFGQINNSIQNIKKNVSVFSLYKYNQRIKIFLFGLRFAVKNKLVFTRCFPSCLEYFAIAYYLIDNNTKKIVVNGIYERYCTLLSALGKDLNIKVIGIQDGAAIDIGVPKKIYIDVMYVFDEFEEKIIRQYIANKNCKYVYMGFKSNLEWMKFDKTKKYLIGVASQDWFTDKTIDILYNLMNELDSNVYQVVVFPHYRETEEQYNKVKEKYPDLIVKTGSRYSNIDLLITFYSTIVYDFWSVNKNLPIFCLHISGYEPAYFARKNVFVFDSIKKLINSIRMD